MERRKRADPEKVKQIPGSRPVMIPLMALLHGLARSWAASGFLPAMSAFKMKWHVYDYTLKTKVTTSIKKGRLNQPGCLIVQ